MTSMLHTTRWHSPRGVIITTKTHPDPLTMPPRLSVSLLRHVPHILQTPQNSPIHVAALICRLQGRPWPVAHTTARCLQHHQQL